MFFDLNNFSSNNKPFYEKSYDFCIIGAGAAGITLALELEKSNFKIALCEAGDLNQSRESRSCYEGQVIGDYYMPLEERRLRFLGGTTNHWGGWTYPLDEIDFNRGFIDKKFIWPINKKDLDPYLKDANDYLDVKNDDSDELNYLSHLKGKNIPNNLFMTDENSDINKFDFRWSKNNGAPTRFGKKFYNALKNSKNIDIFLNCNLAELDGVRSVIHKVVVKNYSFTKFEFSAKKFVFAMGGIENSRYLLWFRKLYGNKFFDGDLPIGKYWMDHPHHTIGKALLNKDIGKQAFFRVNDQLQIKHKILNFGLRVYSHIPHEAQYLIDSLKKSSVDLGNLFEKQYNASNIKSCRLYGAWEQEPMESNKVTLSNIEKDKFSIPRVSIYYKKTELDRFTMKKTMMIFSNWIIKNGLGRIKLDDWVVNNSEYPKPFFQGHHIGGTRMYSTKKFGVVDKDCKVFGSQNLYIIGSSVFTTGGHTNPTLTITQLTLRLANHLIKKSK